MIKSQLINVAARIPAELKRRVDEYCNRNGLKMQFFVTQALRDKLAEAEEGQQDAALAEERLTAPEFVSVKEFAAYSPSAKKFLKTVEKISRGKHTSPKEIKEMINEGRKY